MNLDYVEAGIARPTRGIGKGLYGRSDLMFIESDRLRIVIRERNIARRKRNPSALRYRNFFAAFPRASGAAFPPRMCQLNSSERALAVYKLRNAREDFNVIVFPDAQVLRTDAPFGNNGGRFSEDQGGTANGAGAEMDEVPIVSKTICARILAHGRNYDAVPQNNVANLQAIEQHQKLLVILVFGILIEKTARLRD